MALLGRAREVQRSRDSQEVSNLVHFHANVPRDDHHSRMFLACFRRPNAIIRPLHVLLYPPQTPQQGYGAYVVDSAQLWTPGGGWRATTTLAESKTAKHSVRSKSGNPSIARL